ncbi:MAG: succinate--CoA ligase subunit alpha, partial [Verrucomicrobia bacterium]|nr:succinate--CoA ligase subunit alpha [Verrucomicrobiota bacterium]
GQTTWVGVGGGSICGLRIVDVVKMFNADSATDGIVIIGEIGGTQEEEAARWIRHNCRKPIVGYIAGSVSPGQRRMGHAPALTGNPLRNATDKMEAMREAGIHIATTPSAIPELFFTTPLLG